jgi:hypothetical protein
MLHRVLCVTGALAMVAGLFAMSACATTNRIDTDRAVALSKLVYPVDGQYADDLDIEIYRSGGKVRIINRSTRTFTDAQLWLNQQWVGIVDHIEIGTGVHSALVAANEFELDNFIDQYRRPYPVGSLLAPDKTQELVFAELFVPEEGKRYRLAVRYEPR